MTHVYAASYIYYRLIHLNKDWGSRLIYLDLLLPLVAVSHGHHKYRLQLPSFAAKWMFFLFHSSSNSFIFVLIIILHALSTKILSHVSGSIVGLALQCAHEAPACIAWASMRTTIIRNKVFKKRKKIIKLWPSFITKIWYTMTDFDVEFIPLER